jgi:hypothetical protein
MIAAELLVLAVDPETGRLRNRRALTIGVRGALLAELALDGCLVAGTGGRHGVPRITDADPPADRILATLRTAVRDHPGIAWRRWFTHVSADREAVAGVLVEQGVLEPTGSRLLSGTTYRHCDPGTALALVGRTFDVTEGRRPPDSAEEAIRAVLATVCGALSGRPRPRHGQADLPALLEVLGPPEFETRRSVETCLTPTAAAVRRKRSR